MTQQIGPIGVFNPSAQSIGSGVSNPSGSAQPTILSAWPMNEGSGLTLNDTSGNSNTAFINLAAEVVWQSNAGLPGTSPLFTGDGGAGFALATIAALTSFNGSTPFSLSAWFNPQTAASGSLFGTVDALGGTFQGWELNSAASRALAFILANTITTNWIVVIGSQAGTPGTANYGVVTYDGSKTAAGVNLYMNGVLDPSPTVTGNNLTGVTSNSLPVRFGQRNDGTSSLNSVMAFCKIYSGALTGSQVAANFALGPS